MLGNCQITGTRVGWAGLEFQRKIEVNQDAYGAWGWWQSQRATIETEVGKELYLYFL